LSQPVSWLRASALEDIIMPSPSVILEILDGPGAGKVFTFRKHDTFRLGRSENSSLCLDDDLVVSRNHLQIEIDPPRCFVRDLQSANGTFVNGERIAERLLEDGDTISGGKTCIRVRIEETADESLDFMDTSSAAVSLGKTDLMTLPPARVGGYTLLEQIGSGAMGVVHRAVHQETGELAAVKLIAPSNIADELVINSMIREACVLCRLDHKRIVKFIDTGVASGYVFLIMEYVPVVDLLAILRRMTTGVRIRVACGLMRQVLDGLAHAHDLGVIHRDIKPRNILVSQQDGGLRAKLADFGLAKYFTDAGLSRFSGENEIKGTLCYMAPEQMENSRYATPKADLFSVAATLYTLISDAQLYDCRDGRISIDTILRNGPTSIQRHVPHAPSELVQVLNRALAYDPDARFSNAAEMREALTQLSGM
jgi:serine/threonine-protein kinase